jgi:hypothetical protein
VTRVIDFDAFRAEQKADPLILKLGGHEYELPSSLPATLALDIIRRNPNEADVELESSELDTLGQTIFGGEEKFRRILSENNITLTELPELFKMVFATYNGEPDAPNLETPNPTPTPETGSSTSSKTGHTSKQTS